MQNTKYFEDIKTFPQQIPTGLAQAADLGKGIQVSRATVCGLGGSSLFVDLINDILAEAGDVFRLGVHRSYGAPTDYTPDTLLILASHSGTTEETLDAYAAAKSLNAKMAVFAAGGKLWEMAEADDKPRFKMPGGVQPRLIAGFYIAGMLKLLQNTGLISEKAVNLFADIKFAEIDQAYAQNLAKRMVNKVPVIYATENNSSIARVAKIKFNENSKVQAFHNYFPELNHNEMQGYEQMLMPAFFMIFKSKFTHPRNYKRIEVFAALMREKNADCEIIDMQGGTTTAEIFNALMLADYVSYYLAVEYGVDPEAVPMVEKFKKQLN